MADSQRRAPLHAIYKLQDEVWSVLRGAGIAVVDVRVDEARREVVVDIDPDDVDDVRRMLRYLPDQLITLRARRTSVDRSGTEPMS